MIPGYKILAEIHRGRKRIVYRGLRLPEEAPVIIKALGNELPQPAAVAEMEREYELLRSLPIAGIAQACALELHPPNPVLILEDIGGESLRHLLDARGITLDLFFEIGLQLAATLAAIHQHGIIHKDIAPKNIVVNPASRQVQLIDFSIASRLPHESQKISHPNLLEGTLAYMSPEQTGRMNRTVDYRTDFYSLGVTFYEMLTGSLPFEFADPLELVHAHLAKMPAPPRALNPAVPQALSEIVMKLMAKTAENRYQSGHGLHADLAACFAQWQTGGRITGFIPGQMDFSDRFHIPQKLYGREPEIAALLAAFERVSQGGLELMLVSGYAGIGKSALVNEIHKPIIKQRGYFVSGKFDQFKRNIPYSAIIHALQELLRLLLTESEAQIAAWQDKLSAALAANAQVITDVIPEVEWIIGKPPAVPELPPAESQNRFTLVFQRFLRVFAQKEHPLVIFLDDLQWADSATLKLLHALLTDRHSRFLFVIGAYRDNEVGPAHPLLLTLAEIAKNSVTTSGCQLSNLTLKALAPSHLDQFVTEALRCEAGSATPLSDLIMQKTAGNPFFVTQFLQTLHQEGLLQFDYGGRHWQYDLERIQRLGMTDNVVELMAGKIQKLPAATQQAAKLAACIGNHFDCKTLALVLERPVPQAARDLWEALAEGLILPIGNPNDLFPTDSSASPAPAYRFLHDRVQQAAYALIPPERKKAVHLQVGRLMLQHCGAAEREEKIFDIVNHLNRGRDLMTEAGEAAQLAELNLHAGLKAKSAAAFKPALNYFNTGTALLRDEGWSSHYTLAFALHRELAECEYLCGNFEAAERWLALLLSKARSRREHTEIHNLRIIQHENMAQYAAAVQAGREGLELFGIVLPEEEPAKQAAFAAELQAIANLRGQRAIADLIHLPVMAEADMQMSMKLLMTVWAPAYIAGDGSLVRLVSAMMVRLSLQYGNTEASSYGYVTHAITVGSSLGDYASGYEYGRLALAVNDKFHDVKLRAKVHHMFSCFVNFWRRPIRTCFPHSKNALRAGLESGDFVYATYAAIHESWHAFFCGNDLQEFHKEYAPNVDFLLQIKNHSFAEAQRLILHWGLALQGGTADRTSLSSADFTEATYVREYAGAAFFETFYFTTKLHLHYLFEDHAEARRMALRAEAVIPALFGTLWMTTLCCYHGLTLAALHDSAGAAERQAYAAKLADLLAQMQHWAEHCPENFRHQALLLAAEWARICSRPEEAITCYEQAIQAAHEQGILQHEALAHELYGKFWLARKQDRIARSCLLAAHQCYRQWGALAKVEHLEQRYPQLLAQAADGHSSAGDWQATQLTIGRRPESLDLEAVIKASHVISGEITLARLLEKLMRIVMENAGAQKAILMLEKEGNLVIEAEAVLAQKDSMPAAAAPAGRDEEVIVRRSLPAETSPALAQTIINYVRRTRESVVLANAAGDSRFAHDPYLAQHQTRSLFCLPVLQQSKLTGILYLENNLTTGAFTPDRIAVTQMLSAQAAIALQNAGLYEEMKQEVAERQRAEAALRAALAEVEQLKNRLQAENVYLQEEIRTQQNFEEMAGNSAAIRAVFRNLEKVARTDTTVLITGETGTGKELVARAIHASSHRKDSALITVNCGALPGGLIESELFGHEKGAFTGATTKKKGRFELADGGTIFLDEIGELPLETQTKLLRVLQEQEFERVGGTQTIKVNTRVIAATNRDLEQGVKLGSFRADLFYRLNIFPIHLPALRERRDDIPILTHHFVGKFSRRLGKKIDRVSAEALARLAQYDWPGNVRELANVLERAVILCDGSVLHHDHLGLAAPTVKPEAEVLTLQEAERRHILQALQDAHWVIGGPHGAARRLDLNRTTLLARMKKLGIAKPQ
ncbi:MAG: Anaerobic nitric oxide reductase transcription regulator NorR [bacterium]|nr:Anaerobic nitric oxide reductase transcription regulator NorR [bacterium]